MCTRKSTLTSLGLCGILLGLTLVPMGCKPADRPVVTIGAILPLSGSGEAIGTQEFNGTELALQTLNDEKGGKSGGVRLEVLYEDSKSDPNEALPAFERLLADTPDLLACQSSLSRISSVVVPDANERGVPVLAVATSMPGITDDRPWAFRLHSTSDQEADAMARYWLDNTGVRRVAFFYINDAMGIGARDTFAATFSAGGGEVPWTGAYEQTDTDFAVQIDAALAVAPDAFYVMGFTANAVELVKQLRVALGASPKPVAGNLGMATPEFIAQAGDAYEGVFFTALPFTFEKDFPCARAYGFAQRYRSVYGAEPDIYGGLAYDIMGMIALAVGDRRISRDEFRVNLASIKDYPGVMGVLSMDANREIVLPVGVAQMQGGVLHPVPQMEPFAPCDSTQP